jgi:hypothetical protein
MYEIISKICLKVGHEVRERNIRIAAEETLKALFYKAFLIGKIIERRQKVLFGHRRAPKSIFR